MKIKIIFDFQLLTLILIATDSSDEMEKMHKWIIIIIIMILLEVHLWIDW